MNERNKNSIYKTFIHGVWRKTGDYANICKSHRYNVDKYEALHLSSLNNHNRKRSTVNKNCTADVMVKLCLTLQMNPLTLGQPRQLIQLNCSYTLHGLIVFFSHGGRQSKHSHGHTWLSAEQFFSVALSVLCSFRVTQKGWKWGVTALHETSTKDTVCVKYWYQRSSLHQLSSKCNREVFQMYINRIIYKTNCTFLYPEHFLVPSQDQFQISTDINTLTSVKRESFFYKGQIHINSVKQLHSN